MGNCVGGKGSKKDPTVLTDDEIKLLLNNTKLNKAQINALHHNFLKECPSGKLTKKDFVKLFKEVHPSENKKEKADKFCEYVFKVIDRDNLGYISFQDFVLCFSLTSYGDFIQKCDFAFRLYDLDKDGKISKKEMTLVLEALYDLSGITDRKGDRAPAKKVDDIIRKLNKNQPAAAVPAESPAAAEPAPEAAAAPVEPAEPVAAPAEASKDKKDKKDAKASKERKPKPAKEAKSKPVEAKQAKPAKAAKSPDFITKEQFIEACNTDESIKKLFVDSIFASPTENAAEVEAVIALADSSNLVVKTDTTVDLDQNQDVVTTTTTTVVQDEQTVVNHSEVFITQSEPEEVNNSDNAEPASTNADVESTPAELTQVNSVVEEINNAITEIHAELTTSSPPEPTSNDIEQQPEEKNTDNASTPTDEQAKVASESNVEGKPDEKSK